VNLAARGLRDLDSGSEPTADSAELAQVRRQARMVHLKSFAAAALLTGLLFLV